MRPRRIYRPLGDVTPPGMNPVQYFRAIDARTGVANPLASQGIPYTQGDPNSFPVEASYSDALTFNKGSVPLTGSLAGSGAIQRAMGVPKGFYQNDHFAVRALPAAGLALPFNPKRIALTIQNLTGSASDLYFQLASNVGAQGTTLVGIQLIAGQGYTFDNFSVPADDVYIAWDGTPGSGVIMEGTRGDRTTWPPQ